MHLGTSQILYELSLGGKTACGQRYMTSRCAFMSKSSRIGLANYFVRLAVQRQSPHKSPRRVCAAGQRFQAIASAVCAKCTRRSYAGCGHSQRQAGAALYCCLRLPSSSLSTLRYTLPCEQMLGTPAGIIKGALAALGLHASISVEYSGGSQCERPSRNFTMTRRLIPSNTGTFQLKTIGKA